MNATRLPFDPYRNCEHNETHDLGRGVLVSRLLSSDGPHPDPHDEWIRYRLGLRDKPARFSWMSA